MHRIFQVAYIYILSLQIIISIDIVFQIHQTLNNNWFDLAGLYFKLCSAEVPVCREMALFILDRL